MHRFKWEKKEVLTEIQELLHGQGRRGELGEVIDVFGHVGQRRRLHQRADELHFTCHLPTNERIISEKSAKADRWESARASARALFFGAARGALLKFPPANRRARWAGTTWRISAKSSGSCRQRVVNNLRTPACVWPGYATCWVTCLHFKGKGGSSTLPGTPNRCLISSIYMDEETFGAMIRASVIVSAAVSGTGCLIGFACAHHDVSVQNQSSKQNDV